MTAPKTRPGVEVRTRLTAAEAQAQGRVPPGQVWDEETQQAIARGVAIEAAQLERPLDLAAHLHDWKKNRETLVRFVKEYLEEASYDAKGRPIPGQMRDFYKVPGSQTKALTKRGGEKVANLFRFGKATTEVRDKTETKEYVSATVEVTLVDQYRRPIGSAVSACSTAESGFASDRAKQKYASDYRAALNDVVARAAKRAFVQAVIVAAAGDEMFTTAEDVEGTGDSGAGAPASSIHDVVPADEPTSDTPWPGEGAVKGKRLKDWTEQQLLWLLTPGRQGPGIELWQQLARDEWNRRTKKPAT